MRLRDPARKAVAASGTIVLSPRQSNTPRRRRLRWLINPSNAREASWLALLGPLDDAIAMRRESRARRLEDAETQRAETEGGTAPIRRWLRRSYSEWRRRVGSPAPVAAPGRVLLPQARRLGDRDGVSPAPPRRPPRARDVDISDSLETIISGYAIKDDDLARIRELYEADGVTVQRIQWPNALPILFPVGSEKPVLFIDVSIPARRPPDDNAS
jgi:hypothetical protein